MTAARHPTDKTDVQFQVILAFFLPTFLCYGGKELFAPYVREIGRALLFHVRGAQVYERQNHCHDWMLAGFLPEARAMRKIIAAFIDSH